MTECEYGCDGSGVNHQPSGAVRFCTCTFMAAVPAQLRGKRFDNFDAGRAPEQLGRVRAWADGYTDGCRSLILFGSGKGTGKTHLMAAAANQVIAARRHTDFNQAVFALAPTMLAGIANEQSPILDRATKAVVLFLDDVGQGDEGDPAWLRAKKRTAYFRIIDHRDAGGLTTVCTSNMETVEQFADVIGEAATDRLFGMCGKAGLVQFGGIPSYRLRELLG